MMMKLTVAFLASLATADAAHGRRHIRRDNYGNGYGYGDKSSSSSAAFPLGTGVSSLIAPSSVVVDTPVPSSTALPVEGASSSGVPSLTGGFEYPGSPSGTGSVQVPTSVVVDSASVPLPATTAAPVGSAPFPSGTGISFPIGTGISNSTVPGEYVTTTTIYSTQILTLTVTVPGQADVTSLITSVIPITSLCTKTSGVPDTTALPVETAPVSEIVHVSTETLTYTVGVGSTAHPVTTEIVQTSTETIYKTVVVTLPGAAPSSVAAVGSVVSVEGPSGTTVISSTSTTTKYITVYPTPAAPSGVDSEGSVVVPVPTGPAGECAPPVTQTVTVKETITVTAGQEVPATTEAPLPTSAVILIPSSIASVPYPLGNSTVIAPAGSTGFVTFTKPTLPSGTAPLPTGTEVAPSNTDIPTAIPGTSGLPSFALPSEVALPSSTAAPVETVPAASSSAVPYPAATPSSEYSYGSYRKRSNL